MIFAIAGFAHSQPNGLRNIEVKPWKDNRALCEPRHRLHQNQGCSARSGRAGKDDGVGRLVEPPLLGQGEKEGPLKGFRVRRFACAFEERGDDIEKSERPRPVSRGVADIKLPDRVWRHPFAMHFGKEPCEAIRKIENRRPRGKVGLCLQEPVDKLRDFEPPPQWRDGRRKRKHFGPAQE